MHSNVAMPAGCLVVTIRASKMDQAGRSRQVVQEGFDDMDLCLIAAITKYLKLHGDAEGPLLRHLDGTLLTKYQFCAVLGLQSVKFGTLSFRIGVFSTATAMTYTGNRIQEIG